MKRRRFLSLALALMLIISLCACKTKVVDDSTDATHGNAPVTGQKRDETTTAPQTTKATESTTLAQRKTEKGKLDPNTGTYTGLSPLPKIKLTAADPQNTRGLSTATVGYSYGVSKNGVPHQNSTNAQKYFDEKGFNAVSIDTKTKEKVLYLTFDCGWENGYTTNILDILTQKTIYPGENALLFDFSEIESESARIIGTSARVFDLSCIENEFTLSAKAAGTIHAKLRLRLPRPIFAVYASDEAGERVDVSYLWDDVSRTALFSYKSKNRKVFIDGLFI